MIWWLQMKEYASRTKLKFSVLWILSQCICMCAFILYSLHAEISDKYFSFILKDSIKKDTLMHNIIILNFILFFYYSIFKLEPEESIRIQPFPSVWRWNSSAEIFWRENFCCYFIWIYSSISNVGHIVCSKNGSFFSQIYHKSLNYYLSRSF